MQIQRGVCKYTAPDRVRRVLLALSDIPLVLECLSPEEIGSLDTRQSGVPKYWTQGITVSGWKIGIWPKPDKDYTAIIEIDEEWKREREARVRRAEQNRYNFERGYV